MLNLPVLQAFGDVRRINCVGSFQIGDGSSYLYNFKVASRAKIQAFCCFNEKVFLPQEIGEHSGQSQSFLMIRCAFHYY